MPIKTRRAALAGLALAFANASVADQARYLNAAGYRADRYRAPTPAAAPGAVTLDSAALERLLARAPLLIDVQAALLRQELAEFGDSPWLVSKPRRHIPGSVWLPNVGYAEPGPDIEHYFRLNLAELSGGDLDRPIVIYCVIDCWMSWNAVRRAAGYGYRQLYWYPPGSDGWRAAGKPLAAGQPRPLPDDFFALPNADLDLTRELAVARAAGQQGLLLFFETSDCPFCKRMRREVLSLPEVRRHYRTAYRALALNLDRAAEQSLTGPSGERTTLDHYARRANRVRVTPTLLFYDLNGTPVYRQIGIVADPRAFVLLADYVSGGHYRDGDFRSFYAARR